MTNCITIKLTIAFLWSFDGSRYNFQEIKWNALINVIGKEVDFSIQNIALRIPSSLYHADNFPLDGQRY